MSVMAGGHKIYLPVPNSGIKLQGRRRVCQHLRSRILHVTLHTGCTLRYQKHSAPISSHRSLVTQHQASDLSAFQDEAISLLYNKHRSASLYWLYAHKYTIVNLIVDTSGQNWCSLGWALCSLASLDQQHTLRYRYRKDIFIRLDC